MKLMTDLGTFDALQPWSALGTETFITHLYKYLTVRNIIATWKAMT